MLVVGAGEEEGAHPSKSIAREMKRGIMREAVDVVKQYKTRFKRLTCRIIFAFMLSKAGWC